MWFKTPIRNWMQVLAVIMFVGAPILFVGAIFELSLKTAFLGAFELWMGWRLWTLGSQPGPILAPKIALNPAARL